MEELQPIPKIKTIDVMKHDIEKRAKALIEEYNELEIKIKTPKVYKESDQLRARKKRVAKQSAINEAQMDLFDRP